MVQNHVSMSTLLISIGQQGYIDDLKATCKNTYSSGLQLLSHAVLKHFQWSIKSYEKKIKYYINALLVAGQSNIIVGKGMLSYVSYNIEFYLTVVTALS